MLAKIAFLMVVFSICFYGSNIPVMAEETDDLCNQFCTDKEKFGDKYTAGRMKSGEGQCDEKKKETEEDLCCCK